MEKQEKETMPDVEIQVAGEMQIPQQKQKLANGFDELQVPPYSFTSASYLQAYEWIERRKANIRPWALFFNTNNVRLPPTVSRLGKRIGKNIEYFQSNYLFVFVVLMIYRLIPSPLSLLALAASLGTCYKASQHHAKQEITILNHKLTLPQVYTLIGICYMPLFYLVGAGVILCWVLGVSCILITLHASFYNIDSVLCPGEDELNALVMQEV